MATLPKYLATHSFMTKVFMLSVIASSSAQTVCATGFVMDTFCIQRGTLLDNPSVPSLETGQGPQLHSYHCLLDVPQCTNSGYELLEEVPLAGSTTHCRILRFDSAGNEMLLAFGRARGRPQARGTTCTTCTGTEADEERGLQATVYGTISDAGTNPPTFAVTSIRPASEACNGTVYVPTTRNCGAGGLLSLFRAHGALMLCSWGFLLPLGVTIALAGRHRDPLWFKVHRGCNMLGLGLALVGWIIALTNFTVFSSGGTRSSYAHAVCGCLVMSLGLLQPLNALIRPHKEKGVARSVVRLAWEVWHKTSGYLAVFLSIGTIALGTRIISTNNQTFQVSFAVAWGLVLAVGLYLKCVDAKKMPAEHTVKKPVSAVPEGVEQPSNDTDL